MSVHRTQSGQGYEIAKGREQMRATIQNPFFHAGYIDAREGKPYRELPVEETMQLQYECGRLAVAGLRSEGLRVPKWADWRSAPRKLVDYAEAIDRGVYKGPIPVPARVVSE